MPPSNTTTLLAAMLLVIQLPFLAAAYTCSGQTVTTPVTITGEDFTSTNCVFEAAVSITTAANVAATGSTFETTLLVDGTTLPTAVINFVSSRFEATVTVRNLPEVRMTVDTCDFTATLSMQSMPLTGVSEVKLLHTTITTTASEAVRLQDVEFIGAGAVMEITDCSLRATSFGVRWYTTVSTSCNSIQCIFNRRSFYDGARFVIADSLFQGNTNALTTYSYDKVNNDHMYRYSRIEDASISVSNTEFVGPVRIDVLLGSTVDVDAKALLHDVLIQGDVSNVDSLGTTITVTLPATIVTEKLRVVGVLTALPPATSVFDLTVRDSVELYHLPLDGQELNVKTIGSATDITLTEVRAKNAARVVVDGQRVDAFSIGGRFETASYVSLRNNNKWNTATIRGEYSQGSYAEVRNLELSAKLTLTNADFTHGGGFFITGGVLHSTDLVTSSFKFGSVFQVNGTSVVVPSGYAMKLQNTYFEGASSDMIILGSTFQSSTQGIYWYSTQSTSCNSIQCIYDRVSFLDEAQLTIRDSTITAGGDALTTYSYDKVNNDHQYRHQRVSGGKVLLSNSVFTGRVVLHLQNEAELYVDDKALLGDVYFQGDESNIDAIGNKMTVELPSVFSTTKLRILGMLTKLPAGALTLNATVTTSLELYHVPLDGQRMFLTTATAGPATDLTLSNVRASNAGGVLLDAQRVGAFSIGGVFDNKSYVLIKDHNDWGSIAIGGTYKQGSFIEVLDMTLTATFSLSGATFETGSSLLINRGSLAMISLTNTNFRSASSFTLFRTNIFVLSGNAVYLRNVLFEDGNTRMNIGSSRIQAASYAILFYETVASSCNSIQCIYNRYSFKDGARLVIGDSEIIGPTAALVTYYYEKINNDHQYRYSRLHAASVQIHNTSLQGRVELHVEDGTSVDLDSLALRGEVYVKGDVSNIDSLGTTITVLIPGKLVTDNLRLEGVLVALTPGTVVFDVEVKDNLDFYHLPLDGQQMQLTSIGTSPSLAIDNVRASNGAGVIIHSELLGSLALGGKFDNNSFISLRDNADWNSFSLGGQFTQNSFLEMLNLDLSATTSVSSASFATGSRFAIEQVKMKKIHMTSVTFDGASSFTMKQSSVTVTSGDAVWLQNVVFSGAGTTMCIANSTITAPGRGITWYTTQSTSCNSIQCVYDRQSIKNGAQLSIGDSRVEGPSDAFTTYYYEKINNDHQYRYSRIDDATIQFRNTTFVGPVKVHTRDGARIDLDAKALEGTVQVTGDESNINNVNADRIVMPIAPRIVTKSLTISGIFLQLPPGTTVFEAAFETTLDLWHLPLDGQHLEVKTTSASATLTIDNVHASNGAGIIIHNELLAGMTLGGTFKNQSFVSLRHRNDWAGMTLSGSFEDGSFIDITDMVFASPITFSSITMDRSSGIAISHSQMVKMTFSSVTFRTASTLLIEHSIVYAIANDAVRMQNALFEDAGTRMCIKNSTLTCTTYALYWYTTVSSSCNSIQCIYNRQSFRDGAELSIQDSTLTGPTKAFTNYYYDKVNNDHQYRYSRIHTATLQIRNTVFNGPVEIHAEDVATLDLDDIALQGTVKIVGDESNIDSLTSKIVMPLPSRIVTKSLEISGVLTSLAPSSPVLEIAFESSISFYHIPLTSQQLTLETTGAGPHSVTLPNVRAAASSGVVVHGQKMSTFSIGGKFDDQSFISIKNNAEWGTLSVSSAEFTQASYVELDNMTLSGQLMFSSLTFSDNSGLEVANAQLQQVTLSSATFKSGSVFTLLDSNVLVASGNGIRMQNALFENTGSKMNVKNTVVQCTGYALYWYTTVSSSCNSIQCIYNRQSFRDGAQFSIQDSTLQGTTRSLTNYYYDKVNNDHQYRYSRIDGSTIQIKNTVLDGQLELHVENEATVQLDAKALDTTVTITGSESNPDSLGAKDTVELPTVFSTKSLTLTGIMVTLPAGTTVVDATFETVLSLWHFPLDGQTLNALPTALTAALTLTNVRATNGGGVLVDGQRLASANIGGTYSQGSFVALKNHGDWDSVSVSGTFDDNSFVQMSYLTVTGQTTLGGTFSSNSGISIDACSLAKVAISSATFSLASTLSITHSNIHVNTGDAFVITNSEWKNAGSRFTILNTAISAPVRGMYFYETVSSSCNSIQCIYNRFCFTDTAIFEIAHSSISGPTESLALYFYNKVNNDHQYRYSRIRQSTAQFVNTTFTGPLRVELEDDAKLSLGPDVSVADTLTVNGISGTETNSGASVASWVVSTNFAGALTVSGTLLAAPTAPAAYAVPGRSLVNLASGCVPAADCEAVALAFDAAVATYAAHAQALLPVGACTNVWTYTPLTYADVPQGCIGGCSTCVGAPYVAMWPVGTFPPPPPRGGCVTYAIPCSGHGLCDLVGDACQCFVGYQGADCSESCPGSDYWPCSGHGTCDFGAAPAACVCYGGYNGTGCEDAPLVTPPPPPPTPAPPATPAPPPPCTVSATPCSNNGVCDTFTGKCACTSGYGTPDCSASCPGLAAANICSGHGTCADGILGDAKCSCVPGYAMLDCSVKCPEVAGNTCNGHGACSDGASGDGSCTCAAGYTGGSCDLVCPGAGSACSGHGACQSVGGQATCTCSTGYAGSDCSSMCPGYTPGGPVCGGHGICITALTGLASCSCYGGYSGAGCTQTCPSVILGTPCSGRGVCMPDGTCSCLGGFAGADCATSTAAGVTSVPVAPGYTRAPVAPGTPGTPGGPITPGTPGTPPTGPTTPSTPGTPPSVPTTPGTPSTPGTPPSVPSTPGTPGTPPTVPGTPGTPPSGPGTPPSGPSTPGTPGTPPSVPGTPGSSFAIGDVSVRAPVLPAYMQQAPPGGSGSDASGPLRAGDVRDIVISRPAGSSTATPATLLVEVPVGVLVPPAAAVAADSSLLVMSGPATTVTLPAGAASTTVSWVVPADATLAADTATVTVTPIGAAAASQGPVSTTVPAAVGQAAPGITAVEGGAAGSNAIGIHGSDLANLPVFTPAGPGGLLAQTVNCSRSAADAARCRELLGLPAGATVPPVVVAAPKLQPGESLPVYRIGDGSRSVCVPVGVPTGVALLTLLEKGTAAPMSAPCDPITAANVTAPQVLPPTVADGKPLTADLNKAPAAGGSSQPAPAPAAFVPVVAGQVDVPLVATVALKDSAVADAPYLAGLLDAAGSFAVDCGQLTCSAPTRAEVSTAAPGAPPQLTLHFNASVPAALAKAASGADAPVPTVKVTWCLKVLELCEQTTLPFAVREPEPPVVKVTAVDGTWAPGGGAVEVAVELPAAALYVNAAISLRTEDTAVAIALTSADPACASANGELTCDAATTTTTTTTQRRQQQQATTRTVLASVRRPTYFQGFVTLVAAFTADNVARAVEQRLTIGPNGTDPANRNATAGVNSTVVEVVRVTAPPARRTLNARGIFANAAECAPGMHFVLWTLIAYAVLLVVGLLVSWSQRHQPMVINNITSPWYFVAAHHVWVSVLHPCHRLCAPIHHLNLYLAVLCGYLGSGGAMELTTSMGYVSRVVAMAVLCSVLMLVPRGALSFFWYGSHRLQAPADAFDDAVHATPRTKRKKKQAAGNSTQAFVTDLQRAETMKDLSHLDAFDRMNFLAMDDGVDHGEEEGKHDEDRPTTSDSDYAAAAAVHRDVEEDVVLMTRASASEEAPCCEAGDLDNEDSEAGVLGATARSETFEATSASATPRQQSDGAEQFYGQAEEEHEGESESYDMPTPHGSNTNLASAQAATRPATTTCGGAADDVDSESAEAEVPMVSVRRHRLHGYVCGAVLALILSLAVMYLSSSWTCDDYPLFWTGTIAGFVVNFVLMEFVNMGIVVVFRWVAEDVEVERFDAKQLLRLWHPYENERREL